jgi:hypothetical protein
MSDGTGAWDNGCAMRYTGKQNNSNKTIKPAPPIFFVLFSKSFIDDYLDKE